MLAIDKLSLQWQKNFPTTSRVKQLNGLVAGSEFPITMNAQAVTTGGRKDFGRGEGVGLNYTTFEVSFDSKTLFLVTKFVYYDCYKFKLRANSVCREKEKCPLSYLQGYYQCTEMM